MHMRLVVRIQAGIIVVVMSTFTRVAMILWSAIVLHIVVVMCCRIATIVVVI